ncbi:MAG: UDP-N-acetylmuramoyl-L-alanine--D-glutamate ligase [Candidatus Doudnabacteria bacterium]|nr:UDP-N-acetylmuramoyl-L-alanine--D-glutamate ligase [Candidatus Doudnabacteria bacterium]
MRIIDLSNRLVAVLGYGLEGQAVANYLIKHGVQPVLFDQRAWADWPKKKQAEIKSLGLNFIFGPDAFLELGGFDLAFRSPGIALSHPDLLKWPSLQITSQTKWFFDNCPSKIIGVTGTKGKGTTASLTYEILNKQYPKSNIQNPNIYLTGNIGKVQPFDIIDNLKKEDFIVYELSSFQLQDLDYSPYIGVVLMTTSEHLDYHENKQEYLKAKESILKYQNPDDMAVINADFASSVEIGRLGRGKKFYFSVKGNTADCFVQAERIVLKSSNGLEPVVGVKEIQIRGRHNWENVCAAALAARIAGCDTNNIRQAVMDFKGLEHRLELVSEKRGIKFYNDSFSTTPETAIAGIKAFDGPLVVILGGSKKNSDFADLGKIIASSKNIKALILIGQEAGRIKGAIGKAGVTMLEGAENMQEIFKQIKSLATAGDTVLLSPACASFDMFKNYQDRGEQFKHFVKAY